MRHRVTAGALLVGLFVLAGCSIPPVTTEKRPDGSTVTLDWGDYPGHAYIDADEILATPAYDEIEVHGRALMDAIRTAVADEVGIRLELTAFDGEWRPFETNGYARPSLLTAYACCALVADEVPADYADWLRIQAIVDRVGEEFGAGPLTTERDQEGMRDDPVQLAEFDRTWGTGVEGEYSLLAAWTTGSGQSVMLTIEDPARRLAASAAEKANEPHLSVDYSATVIERGKRAEFEKRLAPYVGAAKPGSTEWD